MNKGRLSILEAMQLAWRKAPSEIGIAGPYALLYGNIDSSEVPTIDPGRKPWGRLVVQEDDSRPTNIKQTVWRVSGSLTLQVFVRESLTNSQATAQKLADHIAANWLSRTKNSDVTFNSIRVVRMPASNGWSNVNLKMDFFYYERRRRD